MRRLARHLFTLCSAVSLVLCVAVCVLWARSDRLSHHVHRQTSVEAAGSLVIKARGLQCVYGRVIAYDHIRRFQPSSPEHAASLRRNFENLAPPRFGVARPGTPGHELPGELAELQRGPRNFGRRQHRLNGLSSRENDSAVAVPLGCLSAVALVLPCAWVVRRFAFARRQRSGRCPSCGYDLRASPERCPECGTAAAAAAAASS